MAKKVKENNEVSAVRRSKHGGVLTVFFSHVSDHFLTTILTEVDIEVGHGNTFGI